MHAENCPVKIEDGSEVSSLHSTNVSILEEDLAISSSTYGINDKTSNETEAAYIPYKTISNQVVYLNEDTMDCSYAESGTPKSNKTPNNDISSPELFDSDDENLEQDISSRRFRRITSHTPRQSITSRQFTQEELIEKSDCLLLAKMNKLLAGIPPPPKHTICQSDCSDFLIQIKNNRQYFWANPLQDNETPSTNSENISKPIPQATNSGLNERILYPRAGSLRNLTTAFDACDLSNSLPTQTKVDSCSINSVNDTNSSAEMTNFEINSIENELSHSSIASGISKDLPLSNNSPKHVKFNIPQEDYLATYRSIDVEQVKSLPWPLAYNHKSHGIHYNRNQKVEEFENLTMKLYQRYIGNETQSTCTPWFTKQTPGSAKKRTLLGKRAVGQSPGKRLSHLARRRKMFSSANLQGMAEKKQLILTVKKPIVKKVKGKSPRGKSPRGKSPRGSTKKRLVRRLSMEGPSPRKSKIETSKRALFQSPTTDRAGPSRLNQIMPGNNPQRIKRALFPTPQKDENNSEENKKRKNDDELEGPRKKWPKSLSYDCGYSLNNSTASWGDRYSTGTVLLRTESMPQPVKSELGEVNRKKLLWAVCEALRSRGITMGHPKFKQYATQLAKTVKKYMPDLENRNIPRKPGSTSDRMLKLAKSHVLLIIDAKCD